MKTILLPGMGADSRMYPSNAYDHLTDVSFVEWPEYKGEKTIEEVAISVIKHHQIKHDMMVGGASLGGMVALEIAKILDIPKVILIGSAIDPSCVNPVLEKLSSLAGMTPVKLMQLFAETANLMHGNVALSMFEQADPDFIHSMCKAIFKWRGIEKYGGKVCHIHGSDDKVIYPPENNVEIIEGGGHVISMTHGLLVAEYIRKNTL